MDELKKQLSQIKISREKKRENDENERIALIVKNYEDELKKSRDELKKRIDECKTLDSWLSLLLDQNIKIPIPNSLEKESEYNKKLTLHKLTWESDDRYDDYILQLCRSSLPETLVEEIREVNPDVYYESDRDDEESEDAENSDDEEVIQIRQKMDEIKHQELKTLLEIEKDPEEVTTLLTNSGIFHINIDERVVSLLEEKILPTILTSCSRYYVRNSYRYILSLESAALVVKRILNTNTKLLLKLLKNRVDRALDC